MPLYIVTHTLRDLVWAPDRQEADHTFCVHVREMSSCDEDCVEVKTLGQLRDHDLDAGCIPWGSPNDATLLDLFMRQVAEAWEARVPVYVVVEEDVGDSLKQHVLDFDKDIDIGEEVVGHVVYRLPDGTFRLEMAGDVEARRASGFTDTDVRRQIEQAKLKKLMAAVQRQMEVVDDLG